MVREIVKFFTKFLHAKKGLVNITADVSSVANIKGSLVFAKLMAKTFASPGTAARFAAVKRWECWRDQSN